VAAFLAARPDKTTATDPVVVATQVAQAHTSQPAAVKITPKTPAPVAAASNQPTEKPAVTIQDNVAFAAAVDALVSPKSSYADRQAALKQLTESGRLQDATAELERRMSEDTNNPIYPAELGQAYLRLCGTTKDVRAQAIWAMSADKSFETALNLDPANWDARFTKAVAMTYWPSDLNKGPEIVDNFNTLIAQQEKQAPEPQFAGTYDWLGKQYMQSGQADLARQAWERGAALFPNNQELQNHLAAATASAAPAGQ